MTTLVDLVSRFRDVRALVVGDVMLDSYLEGTAARLCTEGPVPVVRKTREDRTPGGAGNTAANLQALGADVRLIGIVGNDSAGALLRSALRKRDISDRWLVEDRAISTLHKLRVLADGQYVVRFDSGETRGVSPSAQDRLIANLASTIPNCDLVLVSDYDYGALSDSAIAELARLCRARGCPLVVDSKRLARFRRAGATVITPNYLEACLAAATTDQPGDSVELPIARAAGMRLLEQSDTEHAAITLAGDGVLLISRGGTTTHLPAYPLRPAHDIGAGDTFAAALGLSLAVGASLEESARVGIEAAAITVTKPRTATVQQHELLRRVSLRALSDESESSERGALRLAPILDRERMAGKTIVFTNGVFDILHAGHVQFLRQARELGDILVVGVNSDRSARRIKGASRPINVERDRLSLVAALEAVDHALLFDEDDPIELIRLLRPHIHAKGGDYADRELPETEAVLEIGGRVAILPLVGTTSTSSVIDRIVALSGADVAAAGGLP